MLTFSLFYLYSHENLIEFIYSNLCNLSIFFSRALYTIFLNSFTLETILISVTSTLDIKSSDQFSVFILFDRVDCYDSGTTFFSLLWGYQSPNSPSFSLVFSFSHTSSSLFPLNFGTSQGSGLGLLSFFTYPLVISSSSTYKNNIHMHIIYTHTNNFQFYLKPRALYSVIHSMFPLGCQLDISDSTWATPNSWYTFQTYHPHTIFP